MKRKKLKRLIAKIVREELNRPLDQSPINADITREALAAFSEPITFRRPKSFLPEQEVKA